MKPRAGAHVAPGQIRLVVRDTGVLPGFHEFVQITHRRKLNKFGHLFACNRLSQGCDFVELNRWKGHPGEWIFTAPALDFTGDWATTPGRYFWQAFHINCSVTERDGCHVTSQIGSFHVG